LSWVHLDNYKGDDVTKELALDMESTWNRGDNLGGVYKGWFVPPTTARYRFYMTCDDRCELSIAPCADTTSPLNKLMTHMYAEGYKDFFSRRNF